MDFISQKFKLLKFSIFKWKLLKWYILILIQNLTVSFFFLRRMNNLGLFRGGTVWACVLITSKQVFYNSFAAEMCWSGSLHKIEFKTWRIKYSVSTYIFLHIPLFFHYIHSVRIGAWWQNIILMPIQTWGYWNFPLARVPLNLLSC